MPAFLIFGGANGHTKHSKLAYPDSFHFGLGDNVQMKIRKVFTCFLIILMNFTMFNTAHANSIADSGWNITSSIVNGATTTFNATKNKIINGASVAVTGVAKITPTGPQIGKFILKTGLTLAVTVALDELVQGVDYVLDPANNSIKYKPKGSDSTLNSIYSYQCAGYYPAPFSKSLNTCAAGYAAANGLTFDSCVLPSSLFSGQYLDCTFKRPDGSKTNFVVAYTVYDPKTVDNEEKSIGVDVVGAQIATDAASKDEARVYTNSVANTITAPNEQDQLVPATEAIGQFDNTASYPSDTTSTQTTTTTNSDGTTTTETKTSTIPAACEWFPQACEWFDWTKKDDPINDDPQIDQSNLPTPTLSENAISWGSQCPNPQLINFNLMGQTANIQLSWTPVCTLLSYLYYPILAGAYIAAACIVIGAYKS